MHQRRCPPQIVLSFPLANLIRYASFGPWKNKSAFTATSQTVICLLTSRVIMCWKKAAIFFWCDQGGSHEEQFSAHPTRAAMSPKMEPNLKKGSSWIFHPWFMQIQVWACMIATERLTFKTVAAKKGNWATLLFSLQDGDGRENLRNDGISWQWGGQQAIRVWAG